MRIIIIWASCGKIVLLLLNYPVTFVPGSARCSSALCLVFIVYSRLKKPFQKGLKLRTRRLESRFTGSLKKRVFVRLRL